MLVESDMGKEGRRPCNGELGGAEVDDSPMLAKPVSCAGGDFGIMVYAFSLPLDLLLPLLLPVLRDWLL